MTKSVSARTAADKLSLNSRSHQVYRVRLATTEQEIKAAQRLRFQVFNLEMGEGLAASYAEGLDTDRFDQICDHLIVEEIETGTIVGTYRVQMGNRALAGAGFYSAQEFDFGPLLGHAAEIVELGRACVHKQHRNLVVLGLLWKGIADYAKAHGGRYLVGCSSLTSQNPAEGIALYESLRAKHDAPEGWQVRPMPGYECVCDVPATEIPEKLRAPKLMSAYFSIGAKICGPPAIDAEFKTIDFLIVVDLQTMPDSVAARYQLR
ncbi:MAG: GNAT family N-acyltransferase [Verrucomicrobiota bacterium]